MPTLRSALHFPKVGGAVLATRSGQVPDGATVMCFHSPSFSPLWTPPFQTVVRIQAKAGGLPPDWCELSARRGKFDTIIPTGRKSQEIVLGYGCHHAGGWNGELCPGGIAHAGAHQGDPWRVIRDGGRQGLMAERQAGSRQGWGNADLSMEPDGGAYTPREVNNENRPQ
jgi:hypothetical protein